MSQDVQVIMKYYSIIQFPMDPFREPQKSTVIEMMWI